jgi:antitoxin VapB
MKAMGLNIKNKDVERLIDEVTLLTGESKTEAVRRSLEERRARLGYHRDANDRAGRLRRFLEN